MPTTSSATAPVPTTSYEQAVADLADHGVAVIEGVLSAAEVADTRERLLRAAARSDERGLPTRDYLMDPDANNVRVFLLFNHDARFLELCTHPLALRLARYALDDDVSISNFSANIMGPGSGSMYLHADQQQCLAPWPDRMLAVNVGWILDDYTEASGATRFVPGSHRSKEGPVYGTTYDTVPILAPAGSVMVMDGRVWHQSGVNTTTDVHRAAMFGYYVRSWLRPQMNWNASLDPEVVAGLDDDTLDLLQYRKGQTDLGVLHRGSYR